MATGVNMYNNIEYIERSKKMINKTKLSFP